MPRREAHEPRGNGGIEQTAAGSANTCPQQTPARRGPVGEPGFPHAFYQPRVSSSCSGARPAARDADHRLAEARRDAGEHLGVAKCVVASTIAFARGDGSPGLEDPGADEDAVRAELHAERRVGRGRDPAGGEGHDRQAPVAPRPTGRARTAPGGPSPRRRAPPSRSDAEPADRRRRRRACGVTALTMSPVPASPFVRIIAAPSEMRRSASPRFGSRRRTGR